MQSHTFTRSRGVPIYMNGSVSHQRLYDRLSEPSTSRQLPRSTSLAPTGHRGSSSRREREPIDTSLPSTFIPRFHDESAVRRMNYRQIPGTDIRISKIGAAAIGGMFGNVEDSITKIVETAIKQGINYIDTGYWYSQSRSESILGKIHDADFAPNESIVLYETLQALEMAKASGKIRYIGLTGYPLGKIVQLVDCSATKIDFVMTYCKGTLNNNSLGQFTSWFHTRNIAVINSGALCWGLLTEKGPPPWHPASDEIKEACLAATTYCSSKNISISKLALDYALNFPNIACCLVGMDSVQQVLDNLELANFSRITDVEQRVRDRIMRRYLDRLENAGWEGVDVAQYWKKLKKLGLTALATHRHSSVESLASTLNGFSLYSSNSSSELRTPRRRRPF
uniref:Aldo_ket_red domain-containing protein n=1 Tax=Caenorhabditis tropicalis TaxID=1561998 RepID=A0A1I7T3D6_9PELO